MVTIDFLGAAGTVTGSRYLLHGEEQRLLVDCGLFQGLKELRLRNWEPVPDAMYYNLYFQTTKGVQIKFSELTRPIASADDFKSVIGVKKDKATMGRYVDTDYTKCIGCHICADVCPTGYIQMGMGE